MLQILVSNELETPPHKGGVFLYTINMLFSLEM